MNYRTPLLTDENYQIAFDSLSESEREKVFASREPLVLRRAACQFARAALAECDDVDPRVVSALETFQAYCEGQVPFDEVRKLRDEMEELANVAIDRANELPIGGEDIRIFTTRLQADARARAYTAVLATTLESDLAALAWSYSEGMEAIGIRALIAKAELSDRILKSIWQS